MCVLYAGSKALKCAISKAASLGGNYTEISLVSIIFSTVVFFSFHLHLPSTYIVSRPHLHGATYSTYSTDQGGEIIWSYFCFASKNVYFCAEGGQKADPC